jgi:hypothetical protein
MIQQIYPKRLFYLGPYGSMLLECMVTGMANTTKYRINVTCVTTAMAFRPKQPATESSLNIFTCRF